MIKFFIIKEEATCPECGGVVIEGVHAEMCEDCGWGVRYSW